MINRFKLEKQFSICNTYPELISPPKYYVSKHVIDCKFMVIEIYVQKDI